LSFALPRLSRRLLGGRHSYRRGRKGKFVGVDLRNGSANLTYWSGNAMKKVHTLAAVAALGMAVNAASAALLVADGFNYPTGGLAGNADVDYPTNPATWAYTAASSQLPGPVVVAGNTTYTGPGALAALPGSNSGEFTAADNGAARIQLTSPATAFSQTANAGSSLYYSFTMSVSDISKLSSGTGGSFTAGFNNSVGPQTSS